MTGMAINAVISFCLKCEIQSKEEGDEPLGSQWLVTQFTCEIKQTKWPEIDNTALKSILLCSQYFTIIIRKKGLGGFEESIRNLQSNLLLGQSENEFTLLKS